MTPTSPKSEDDAILTGLRRQAAASGARPRRFRRLAAAIAASAAPNQPVQEQEGGGADEQGSLATGLPSSGLRPGSLSSTDIDCDACQEMLDVIVSDELHGIDVRARYPLVWAHLEHCAECWQAYDLVSGSLQPERALVPPPAFAPQGTPRLSFVQPRSRPERSQGPPWTARLRSRLAGAPFGLAFSFNLDYLRTLLAPPAPLTVRSGEERSIGASIGAVSHLLLSDAIAIGDQRIAVEVRATRQASRPDGLLVQAVIAGSTPLPQPLWARLIWAGQARSSPVQLQNNEGRADFGEVSLTALEADDERSATFTIAFEVADAQEGEDHAVSTTGLWPGFE